jgi:hypothetical protein
MFLAFACNGGAGTDSADTSPPESVDNDGDGFFSPGSDCDDDDKNVNPLADEVCDGKDNDCDGEVDIDAVDGTTYYADNDGDGFGGSVQKIVACEQPEGYITDNTDCNDTTDQAYPGGIEVCDGLDNDCDFVADRPYFQEDLEDVLESWELTVNGSAGQVLGDNGYLELTSTAAAQIGTAFIPTPIPGDVFYARFTVEIGGGDGGEGLAFAFLDETDPTSVGANNAGLGIGGLKGYAIEIDMVKNGNDSGDDLIALVQTDWDNGGQIEILELAAGAAPDFQDTGPHKVEIFFDNGDVIVTVDDTEVMTGTISDYDLDEVMIGFTGTTSTLTNQHLIDDIYIGCPSRAD